MQKYTIEIAPACFDAGTMEKLQESLKNNISNSGKSISKFQSAVAKATGTPAVLAVNSGTSALHLALLSLGIREGDKVACPTFTFVATANAIRYVGAVPVFIDSEMESYNMDPELLEKALKDDKKREKKIKAVMVVHAYGMPAQLDYIVEVCKDYDVFLIEDAASALGSSYDEKHLGSFGECGIISFNYNKIISTTGGGVLISGNERLIKEAFYFANQAKDNSKYYEHQAVGYNYKISGICAELGSIQMPLLQERVSLKREIFNRYYRELNNIDGLQFLIEPARCFSNRWITTVLFKTKEVVQEVSELFYKNNIEVRFLWKPMHLQPVFSNCSGYLHGKADEIFGRGMCLPSGLNLTEKYQEEIINLLLSFFERKLG